MVSYHEKKITLQDAMDKDLSYGVRAWSVQGLHVGGEFIPERDNVISTYVMNLYNGDYLLGVNTPMSMIKLGKFSTLEELKVKFPELFKLEGTLHAFG